MAIRWNEVLQHDQVNKCCDEFMINISHIVDNCFKCQNKSQRKIQLPWINDTIYQLMKQRDHALKTFLKTRHDIDSVSDHQ